MAGNHFRTLAVGAALALATALLAPAQGLAQTTGGSADGGGQTAKKQAAAGGGSELRQRVDQIEEQIVDMQVVVGTLESLARGGTPSAGAGTSSGFDGGSMGGDLEGRVSGMEGQLRVISTQLAELRAQIEALNRRAGIVGSPATGAAGGQGAVDGGGLGSGDLAQSSEDDGFGSITIDPAEDDAIGQVLSGGESPPLEEDAQGQQTAALAPESGNPDKMYEAAYGLLLQQDYEGAEASFSEFLTQHPKSKLAGNAQYWLGETYYVRGRYKDAANAFLVVYDRHKKSQKAPDALLKLAMSLSRLGQREPACSAFEALESDYPTAPAQVMRRAQSERQRAGC